MKSDQELKQLLARMLPEKLHHEETNSLPKTLDDALLNPSKAILLWKTKGALIKNWTEVLDTELLQICQDIENKLTAQDHFLFREKIRATTRSNREEYSPSWQQRTIALAQVKQIEII